MPLIAGGFDGRAAAGPGVVKEMERRGVCVAQRVAAAGQCVRPVLPGGDTFRCVSQVDSNASGGIDRIEDFDFGEGDRVDVSAIDANFGTTGNQAFTTEIAAGVAFSAAGQYRFSQDGISFLAEFNVDGDDDAEPAIRFQGADLSD